MTDKINSVAFSGVSMYHIDTIHEDGTSAGSIKYTAITISWSGERGFGEFVISDRGDKGFRISDEYMGKEFVKAVLCKLVDDADMQDSPRCKNCKKCHTSLRSGGYFCPSCEPVESEPLTEDEESLTTLLDAAKSVVVKCSEEHMTLELFTKVKELNEALDWFGMKEETDE